VVVVPLVVVWVVGLGVVDVVVVVEESGIVELGAAVACPGWSGDTHPGGAGEGTG
jgi:hypothetical protein